MLIAYARLSISHEGRLRHLIDALRAMGRREPIGWNQDGCLTERERAWLTAIGHR